MKPTLTPINAHESTLLPAGPYCCDSLTRRRFLTMLSASAASLAVQACGGSAGVAPAPAEELLAESTSVSPPLSTAIATPAGALAAFQLTSSNGGASLPFSLGHAFKQGDVPAGARVIGSISELQVIAKNTWPDGSLKFATIAGRATLGAGVPLTVSLGIGTGATSANLTTANLQSTGAVATVDAGAFGAASWIGADWAAPFIGWISGPFMSAWIYRKPLGADPHLVAWLEVRLFRGGAVEILPWIENGYLTVANPSNKSARYTFTLGGTQRFSAAIDLPNHCRTVLLSGAGLSHWLGTAARVTPTHDKSYLQASALVPTYRATVASTAPVWATLAQTYTPMQQGNYSNAMGQGGYQGAIGLLPEWDVLYLTSNDPRAYRGVLINAYSAGRYGIHYRDETTLRPLRFSSYPNLVVNGSQSSGIANSGASTRNTFTPAASGTTPPTWDCPHHPSVAFTAYLLTGSFYFMEEVQFAATINFLLNTDATRKFSAGVFLSNAGANTTRGAGWAIRTLAQAACITPDDDVLRAEFIGSMAANVDFYHATYVAQPNNPQGFVAPYSNYSTASGVYAEAASMQDFFTAATGYAIDITPGMSALSNTKLAAFFAWKAQSIIGRLGGTTQLDYLYRDAGVYTVAVAPSAAPNFSSGAGPWYANWGEIYRATLGGANPGTIGSLRGGHYPESTSYWGNLQPAIAYAVHHKVPGAMAAYTRMLSAPNWNDLLASFNMAPVWSVAPDLRDISAPPVVNPGLPAWVPPAGYFADVPMLNAPQDVMPAMYRSGPGDTAAMDGPFILWGGSAILQDFSARGAQVYYSGGHESSAGQANIQLSLICDFSTLTWSVANLPMQVNPSATFVNGYAPDGTPYCPHSYLGLQEVPKAWGGGPKGSLAAFFWAGTSFENRINLLDVSRSTLGYSQFATRQTQNADPSKIRFSATSAGGNYPITVIDPARQGWWAAVGGTVMYTLFVSRTGEITQYPALGGNLANGSMVLCHSLNLLIAIDGGYSAGAYAGTGYRTMYLRDLATGAVSQSTTLGTVPSLGNGYDGSAVANYHRPDALGLQWVDELGCIVGFDQSSVPPTIVKLTPPASSPATGAWTWSTLTVTHWAQDSAGQASLQTAVNDVWSKFRWVPSLQGFVYATAKNRKPQIIKLS